RVEDRGYHAELAGEVPGQLGDQFELPAEGVLVALQWLKPVEVRGAGDDARGRGRPRVAVVVHDLEEVQVVGLDVLDVGSDSPRAGDGLGTEVIQEGEGRRVRLPARQHRIDTLDLVHGEPPGLSVPAGHRSRQTSWPGGGAFP